MSAPMTPQAASLPAMERERGGPARVIAVFMFGGDCVVTFLQDATTAHRCWCRVAPTFEAAYADAVSWQLIPVSSLERVRTFPLGPEFGAVVGEPVHCGRDVFRHFRACGKIEFTH